MSGKTPLNSSAFPVVDDIGRGLECADRGMTLRDWFAGQALAGSLASGLPIEPDQRARICYMFADAMMKARGAV